MKIKDIPEEIGSSKLVGELMGWNLLTILIEELPNSSQKDKILELIDERQKTILELNL